MSTARSGGEGRVIRKLQSALAWLHPCFLLASILSFMGVISYSYWMIVPLLVFFALRLTSSHIRDRERRDEQIARWRSEEQQG